MSYDIKIIDSDKDIIKTFPIMKSLVKDIKKDCFLERVKAKKLLWYNMVGLYNNKKLISLIWFRFYEYFSCGKFLIIDDFVTHEKYRGMGFGTMIFDRIIKYAKKNNCSEIQLDSNISRYRAHKFYMNMWMKISHHHFSLNIN